MTTKLQRSIHNQLDVSTSPLHVRKISDLRGGAAGDGQCKRLILRKYDLLQPQILKAVLTRCRPHLRSISKLDISFSITDFSILNQLCPALDNLQTLHAKSCGLSDASTPVSWPRRLQDLDLSRNELSACPQGVCELLHLSKLNLSGNRIEFIPPAILQIPCLKKCLLLNNPIRNVPKDICREGVEQMRQYLAVEPHPLPQDAQVQQTSRSGGSGRRRNTSASISSISSLENCTDLRRLVLSSQGSSFESDYDSSLQCHSPISTDSLSSMSTDMEFSECSDVELDSSFSNTEWREFDTSEIPPNYIGTKSSQLCQVYLPSDCSTGVEIQEVRDLSLHPTLRDNQLLITPVIRITPHGLNFGSNPAILVLSHCTKRNRAQEMDLEPICSSTHQHQAPKWVAIDDSECEIFAECVMFKVSHFSLFAVIATFPYPSLSVDVRPGVGGALLVPELPGFSLHIPNESVQSLKDRVSVKVTVFYCDQQYRASHNNSTPASACIGMEPHGMEFDSPVEISIPIPDYTTIVSEFPEARLELWCSREAGLDGITPHNWQQVESAEFRLQRNEECDSHVLQFTTSHFSWYELLWSLCTAPLQKLHLGAMVAYDQLRSRAKYISVRFQAFMSHPHGNSRTFGLAVTVYKFGDPLPPPSNYPLLVADSGGKRMFLRIGELHVRVEGYFVASRDVGEEDLERAGQIVDFAGEDFCERFEFVLSLKGEVTVPLQEGQVLGKLRFIQWDQSSNPVHKSYNLIVPPSSLKTSTQTTPGLEQAMNVKGFQTLAEFTPPQSPEPDASWGYQVTPSNSFPTPRATPQDNRWLRKRFREHSPTLPGPSPRANCDHTPKRQALLQPRNSELTDRVLLSVSQKCGSKFMELGISLGLDYETISNRISRLDQGRKAEHLKAFEVLQEWKARGASYEALARALEEIGLNSVALKTCYVSEQ